MIMIMSVIGHKQQQQQQQEKDQKRCETIILLGHIVDKTPTNLIYNGLETDRIGGRVLTVRLRLGWILWMHT